MLSLSCEAAPDLPLDVLYAACAARGLAGLEIALPRAFDVDVVLREIHSSRARVVAARATEVSPVSAPALARLSAALGVPVSALAGTVDVNRLADVAAPFAAAGGKLLLAHGTNLDEALSLVSTARTLGAGATLGVAWELSHGSDELDEASAVLLATRELLGVVRLHGGGPEQREHDGLGIGAVISELALSGFAGPIVLCPSSPATTVRWTEWLESRPRFGCGHAVSTRAIDLDVRDVEPRHRFETIMGAYRQLGPGATLHLTVDHDPVCMYYTLEANEPPRSFSFAVLEDGPEVWRADVTKH